MQIDEMNLEQRLDALESLTLKIVSNQKQVTEKEAKTNDRLGGILSLLASAGITLEDQNDPKEMLNSEGEANLLGGLLEYPQNDHEQ